MSPVFIGGYRGETDPEGLRGGPWSPGWTPGVLPDLSITREILRGGSRKGVNTQ